MLEKRFESKAAIRNENCLAGGFIPNIEIWGKGVHGEFGNLNDVYGTPVHLVSPTSSVLVCCGVGPVKGRMRKAYNKLEGRRAVARKYVVCRYPPQ